MRCTTTSRDGGSKNDKISGSDSDESYASDDESNGDDDDDANDDAIERATPSEAQRSAERNRIYSTLTKPGSILKPVGRTKLAFTGEGRAGKTSTRRALKNEQFNPLEPSTIGAISEGVTICTMQREDIENWSLYIPPPDSHRRALAEFAAAVIRGDLSLDALQSKALGSADDAFIAALRARCESRVASDGASDCVDVDRGGGGAVKSTVVPTVDANAVDANGEVTAEVVEGDSANVQGSVDNGDDAQRNQSPSAVAEHTEHAERNRDAETDMEVSSKVAIDNANEIIELSRSSEPADATVSTTKEGDTSDQIDDAGRAAAEAAVLDQADLDRLVQECLDREAKETPLVRALSSCTGSGCTR